MNSPKMPLLNFRVSNRVTYAFWFISSLAMFFSLFDLEVLLAINVNPYILVAIVTYIVLLPALSSIKNAGIFFALFPALLLGSWAMCVFYLSLFSLPVLLSSAIASAIPVILTISIHLESRMRNTIFKKSMTSFARISLGLSSTIFFLFALLVFTPIHIEIDPIYLIELYSLLQFAYILSSMHLLNTAYRYRVLCLRLNISSIERKEKEIWQKIEDEFSNQRKDVDLLRYYHRGAIDSFLEGAYQECFLLGYQMICEKTVVDPKNHISDKRDGKPESFSEIRTILMHSRRKETEIDTKTIVDTKRKLPQYCVELLLRDFALLEALAHGLPKAEE